MRPSNERPAPAPQEVYLDESFNRGGYDLIGGLWMTQPAAKRVRGILAALRERHDYTDEIKWGKASGSELSPFYRDLARLVGDQIRSGRVRFNCIVLTRRLIKYRDYHDGDKELGFYKFMHLLVVKRVEAGSSYVVHADYRQNRKTNRLETLRDTVNRVARRDYGLGYDCCRDVRSVDSKIEDLVQLADVLLGAVGWHYAGKHYQSDSSLSKNLLADLLAKSIGKDDFTFSSGPFERKFNIWRWTPEEHLENRKPPRS